MQNITPNINIQISPCPNDTYIFGALALGKIKSNFAYSFEYYDIDQLNSNAIQGGIDLVKVSYGVISDIAHQYDILRCGGALGFGVGPVLVSRHSGESEISVTDKLVYNKNFFDGKTLAIPGDKTSAYKVFRMLFDYAKCDVKVIRYDKIYDALSSGEADYGILIHESRFTYAEHGFSKVVDLGSLYEKVYNAPIPLGAIAIKKEPSDKAHLVIEDIQNSIKFAQYNQSELDDYIAKYAQEIDKKVRQQHIDLFVNEYSYEIPTTLYNTLYEYIGTDRAKIY